jgi:hypothetical protein
MSGQCFRWGLLERLERPYVLVAEVFRCALPAPGWYRATMTPTGARYSQETPRVSAGVAFLGERPYCPVIRLASFGLGFGCVVPPD